MSTTHLTVQRLLGMLLKAHTILITVSAVLACRLLQVRLPDDPKTRFIIDSMALYVLKDGCEFEQLMMMEHQGQPEFSFLFELDSPEHIYYRYSRAVHLLCNPDTEEPRRRQPPDLATRRLHVASADTYTWEFDTYLPLTKCSA
eukprot:GHUV01045153.1.p1 GENE.GHUV01045153.1~~GHUV01045153.1.p1  ORF type:complete len:154 (-),score=18.34 GHUV01045153.1:446-877(-)